MGFGGLGGLPEGFGEGNIDGVDGFVGGGVNGFGGGGVNGFGGGGVNGFGGSGVDGFEDGFWTRLSLRPTERFCVGREIGGDDVVGC